MTAIPLPLTVDAVGPGFTADSDFLTADGGFLATIVAPPQDLAGAALMDAIIAAEDAAVTASMFTLPAMRALINQLQVQAVDHFMVTGWLNAAAIIAQYPAPVWDRVGQVLTARVAFLQNLVNNAPAMPPGNANGYGAGGIVTVLQNYQQALYAAQITLVERIMDVPGGTSAATILASMTGFQSFPFEYKFTSVGFADAWIDD